MRFYGLVLGVSEIVAGWLRLGLLSRGQNR